LTRGRSEFDSHPGHRECEHALDVARDPDRVADGATYEDSLASPVAIAHVVANGSVVIRDGRDNGTRAERVLEPT